MRLGATVEAGGTRFRAWAPRPRRLEVELVASSRRVPFARDDSGYQEARVAGAGEGERYFFIVDGERRLPDPASRSQPEGVHGPSQIVDPGAFRWQHERIVRPLAEYLIYELHIGTFTRDGTFDAARAELDRLVELGVTAVEIMPVGSFAGARNWGYDGVDWFAPQCTYGGPDGLRRFVDACHGCGLAVVLDVVYNHLGPEGNYLAEFGPYFTHRHATPWGDALDYSADPVRELALENARMWIEEYRIDALRLDAVHAIVDDRSPHLVAELAAELHRLGAHAIAESDLGDTKVIEPGGWSCDAEWADDLHHALHAALTGERDRYYADFGRVSDVARALEQGRVYTGQLSSFRKRPFGMPAKHLSGERLVVCAQNHDQIGNRALGERLGQLVPRAVRAAAAVTLLAPAVPLLFMGEEHADPAPFLYFTDHQDAALASAVSEGRRREFRWAHVDVPDPQAPATFERSRIDLALGDQGVHGEVRRFYRALLALRRERLSLRRLDWGRCEARGDDVEKVLVLRRWSDVDETAAAISLSAAPARALLPAPRSGEWQILLEDGRPEVRNRTRALEVFLPAYGILICGVG